MSVKFNLTVLASSQACDHSPAVVVGRRKISSKMRASAFGALEAGNQAELRPSSARLRTDSALSNSSPAPGPSCAPCRRAAWRECLRARCAHTHRAPREAFGLRGWGRAYCAPVAGTLRADLIAAGRTRGSSGRQARSDRAEEWRNPPARANLFVPCWPAPP